EPRRRNWTAARQDQAGRCRARRERLLVCSKLRLCQPAVLCLLPGNQHGHTTRCRISRAADTVASKLVSRTRQIGSCSLSSLARQALYNWLRHLEPHELVSREDRPRSRLTG